MKSSIYYFLLFFLSAFLVSCQYELSEDFYTEISIEDPNYNLTVTNFYNGELLRNSKTISFSYSSTKNKAYSIKFFIDGNEVYANGYQEKEVFLDITNLENGEHNLKVELILKSETGSLADVNGQEFYRFNESFKFSVDKSVKTIEITKIKHKNGSIYVHWTPPTEIEQYKKIYLNIEDDGYWRRTNLLDNDSIVKQGIYKDSLSLDFNMKYSIEVINDYSKAKSVINDFYVKDSLISITHEILDKNSFKIKWGKHPLYNNFDNYKINYSLFDPSTASYSYNEEIIDKLGGEKIINAKFIYGGGHSYHIKPIREHYFIPPYKYIFYRGVVYGTKFTQNDYDNLIFDKAQNCFFGFKFTYSSIKVFKLRASDLTLLNKIELQAGYSIWRTPSFLLDKNNDLILNLAEKSIILNTANLTIKKEYFISDYIPNIDSRTFNNSQTSYRNGVVLFDDASDYGTVSIFNSVNKQLLLDVKKEFGFKAISQNSEYFSVNRSIYKTTNNTVTLIHSFPDYMPRISDLDFAPSINSVIISFGDNSDKECIFLNLNNNTTTSIPETGLNSYLNFDTVSNKVLFVSKQYNIGKAIIYDVDTKESFSMDVGDAIQNYLFLNNYLMRLKYNYYLKYPF